MLHLVASLLLYDLPKFESELVFRSSTILIFCLINKNTSTCWHAFCLWLDAMPPRVSMFEVSQCWLLMCGHAVSKLTLAGQCHSLLQACVTETHPCASLPPPPSPPPPPPTLGGPPCRPPHTPSIGWSVTVNTMPYCVRARVCVCVGVCV